MQGYIRYFSEKNESSSREFFQRPHSSKTDVRYSDMGHQSLEKVPEPVQLRFFAMKPQCDPQPKKTHLHVHHLHHHTPSRFIHACHSRAHASLWREQWNSTNHLWTDMHGPVVCLDMGSYLNRLSWMFFLMTVGWPFYPDHVIRKLLLHSSNWLALLLLASPLYRSCIGLYIYSMCVCVCICVHMMYVHLYLV